MNITAKANEF